MNWTYSPKRAGAFTLPEMLVSVVILAIIVVLLSSMIGAVNKAWLSGRERVENFQNGRAILDIMARELSSALISPNLQFVQNPGTAGAENLNALLAAGYQQVPNSDSLFWQTPITPNTYGNVCEVGYFLTRNTTKSEYQLQRFYVPPDILVPTNANHRFRIYDGPTTFSGYTATSRWLPGDAAPWLTKLTPAQFQASAASLSDGVIALWIRCLDVNREPIPWLKASTAPDYSSSKPLKYNSAAGFNPAIPGASKSFQYTDKNSTLAANRLPDAVEITIVTVDYRTLQRQGASIPAAMPVVNKPEDIPGAITQFTTNLMTSGIKTAQVFTTTVRVNNRAN